MKSKTGIVCIVLGALLIVGALALSVYNMRQETAAQDAMTAIMPQLVEQIRENTSAEPDPTEAGGDPGLELQIPVELLTEEDKKMTEMEIDGHAYIGYLSLPALELDLPVMSGWSYPKLKIAPCRYQGSIRGEDLVIMAHNFYNHFGRISQLEVGDRVSFTDMDAQVTEYTVVGMDVLEPTAVEVVTQSQYDLILFTCTYGGGSRVMVYCDRVQ